MDARLTIEFVMQPHSEAERALDLTLDALADTLAERVLAQLKGHPNDSIDGLKGSQGDSPADVRDFGRSRDLTEMEQ